ncbi:MAG: FliH/SctL family protein [Carboxydocellales bacterium]
MSSSASKVIKSERLKIALPYSLQGRYFSFDATDIDQLASEFIANKIRATTVSETEEAGNHSTDLADILEPQETRESVQKEVAMILAETEEMVMELLSSAREQAENIMQQAKEEAENILISSKDEVDSLKEQAEQTGYQEGYTRALHEVKLEAEKIRKEADCILETANEEKTKIMVEAECDIVKLAIAVAEKVIREELRLRPKVVVNTVKAALGLAIDMDEIIIKVNPEDVDFVLCLSDELRKQVQGKGDLKIISDVIISRGSCVVETSIGTVDARVERQLSEIFEALMEVN